MEEFRLAHQAFDRSLKQEGESPLTYLYLGELLTKESRPKEAAHAYLKAQRLSPLWAEPARRLGTTYSKMDRLGDAYYYLARSHLLTDEDEKAVIAFEQALKELDPESSRSQMIRGELEAVKERL